ncbi:dTMP kinase [Buchnera aphidicola]|uniref:Thymidylate kinase n=1 Tax=Buchnera aphidicola (Stegophylla sp.) TaxID=2315800 RepID=A0A4D6YAC6_9GAMM|nr:dTMP kinase [Buchnera aphidicola (Stegophylla sp.)]QCI26389.1 dTMP kinase [Buchnera aphidicola (Stegophylla sp.)]
MRTSKFIVLEGLDGSGKTYACMTVKKILKKNGIKKIIIVREPGSTPIAEKIRNIIKNFHNYENIDKKTILLLMYACRIQLIKNIIKPNLKKNIWVISDRHDMSTFAYQGGGFGIEENTIKTLRNMMIGDFYPDLTIYLDVIPKISLQRIFIRSQPDNIEINNIDFFHKIRNSYLQLVKKNSKNITINANLNINIVQQDIKKKIEIWLKYENNMEPMVKKVL